MKIKAILMHIGKPDLYGNVYTLDVAQYLVSALNAKGVIACIEHDKVIAIIESEETKEDIFALWKVYDN